MKLVPQTELNLAVISQKFVARYGRIWLTPHVETFPFPR